MAATRMYRNLAYFTQGAYTYASHSPFATFLLIPDSSSVHENSLKASRASKAPLQISITRNVFHEGTSDPEASAGAIAFPLEEMKSKLSNSNGRRVEEVKRTQDFDEPTLAYTAKKEVIGLSSFPPNMKG